ncbi:hypothetical protein V5799_013596 [Amblyomma americanum]|uniref:Uncharacterized protein n=1 Tax=Amblyomma americanum TaxID=6943 RepID=A0AAQ4E5H6_AMBAM
MTSRFTVSKTEKNLLANDASAECRYGSTGRGSASGYEDADFHDSRLRRLPRQVAEDFMHNIEMMTYDVMLQARTEV